MFMRAPPAENADPRSIGNTHPSCQRECARLGCFTAGKISAYDDRRHATRWPDTAGPGETRPMRLFRSYLTLGIAVALALAASVGAAFAQQSAEEFFRSRKEMTFITSSPPGGGY